MHRASESLSKLSGNACATIRSGGLHSIVVSYPGRIGYWRVGVPPSGPMDDFAFRAGNQLLGNNDIDTAGLEITYKGPIIEFEQPCVISLTGAKINNATITNSAKNNKEHNISKLWWQPIELEKGSILNLDSGIDANNVGVRSYLNINNNGFVIDDYLGSKTSFPLGKFGGFKNNGTVLQGNDVLMYDTVSKELKSGQQSQQPKLTSENIVIPNDYLVNANDHMWDIGILIGPQSNNDYITESDANILYNTRFQVSHNASRLGIRLNIINDDSSSTNNNNNDNELKDLLSNWPQFARIDGGEGGSHPSNLIDNPYAIGAINFTGSHPVVLTVDGPSLGGFICPVTVPTNEIWKIGQLKPNDVVRFHVLDLQTALKEKYETELMLAGLNSSSSGSNNTQTTTAQSARGGGVERVLTSVPEKVVIPLDKDQFDATMREYGDMESRALLKEIEEDGNSNQPRVCYRLAGDKYMLIEYGRDVLDLNIRVRIHKLEELLLNEFNNNLKNNGIIDTIPGVRTLLVEFNPFVVSLPKLLDICVDLESVLNSTMDLSKNEIVIPTHSYHLPLVFKDEWTHNAIQRYMNEVRSEAVYLPSNVEFICENNGLSSIDELEEMVFSTTYCALGLGDVYLGAPCAVALDPRQRLNVPKYNPSRNFTPEGAVGLGGQYMCIYPMESPGGYQLVGRTLPIWDKEEQKPWLLDMFDTVSFYPVTMEQLLKEREEFLQPNSRERCINVKESEFNLNEYNKKYVENEAVVQEVQRLRAKQLIQQKKKTSEDNAILARLNQSLESMKGICYYLAQMVVNGPKHGTNGYVYITENKLDLDFDLRILIDPMKPGQQLTIIDKNSSNKQYSIKLISINPSIDNNDIDPIKYDLKFTINSVPFTAKIESENSDTTSDVSDESSETSDSSSSSSKSILSGNFDPVTVPMPGKIVKILVSEGDVVSQGTCVAVMSAMKMETEITSHVSGRIESIFVTHEDVVAVGDIVVHVSQ